MYKNFITTQYNLNLKESDGFALKLRLKRDVRFGIVLAWIAVHYFHV